MDNKTAKEQHTEMDALVLSVRRLKAKGLSLHEIADRHGLTIKEVILILTRKK